MSDGNFNRNPNQKPPTVLGEFALRLTGEKLGDNKRPPSLQLDVKRDGKSGPWNVTVNVRTNVENDKEYGRISLGIDASTFMMMMGLLQKATEWTEAGAERIELHSRRFIRSQNAMSKDVMLDGVIAIGRQSDGQIYIGVQSWDNDRPKCKFILTPVVDFRRAVKLYHKDGSPWDAGELSQRFTQGWVKALTQLVLSQYNDAFTPPEQRPQQGGGNGGNGGGNGGWNRGGNGGNNSGGGGNGGWGGNNNSGGNRSAPSDDWGQDIPM